MFGLAYSVGQHSIYYCSHLVFACNPFSGWLVCRLKSLQGPWRKWWWWSVSDLEHHPSLDWIYTVRASHIMRSFNHFSIKESGFSSKARENLYPSNSDFPFGLRLCNKWDPSKSETNIILSPSFFRCMWNGANVTILIQVRWWGAWGGCLSG